MFRINDVYKLQDKSFRILKMTPHHIVWIDIDSPNANPFLIEKNELIQSIEANEAELSEDPFVDIALLKVVEGSIQQQKRDAGMALIRPLITHDQFLTHLFALILLNVYWSSRNLLTRRFTGLLAGIGNEVKYLMHLFQVIKILVLKAVNELPKIKAGTTQKTYARYRGTY